VNSLDMMTDKHEWKTVQSRIHVSEENNDSYLV